jgi:hypothetical protein
MSSKLCVYRLETYRFDSKYARFEKSNPKTFPEFYPRLDDDAKWVAPRLAKTWKPQKLIGNVWPLNDYPGESAPAWLIPVFSPRAVEGLREFLEPNGELLPVLTPLGTYYAYNVTRVVDVLDLKQSDVDWSVGGRWRADEINRFEFKAEVKDLTIFKIPQMPVQIYVTEPFVQCVRELRLNGMWITKCWPMAKGEDWHLAWRAKLERMKSDKKQRNGPILPSKPAAAVRAPTILDLRKEAKELVALAKQVMKWIRSQQQDWSVKGEYVTGIGLESSGWDLDYGPEVMCHVDTRDGHELDGHWSYFHVAAMSRPKWSAMSRALQETGPQRVVIDVRGKEHRARRNDDRESRWFGEAMVAALKAAREQGVFDGLLRARKCLLSATDYDTGFGWSQRGAASGGV